MGGVEQPLVGAAGFEHCTGGDAVIDDRLDVIELALVDDRPQRHRVLGRVAHRQLARFLGQTLGQRRGQAALDQHAAVAMQIWPWWK